MWTTPHWRKIEQGFAIAALVGYDNAIASAQ
jgi:hypothetical protein